MVLLDSEDLASVSRSRCANYLGISLRRSFPYVLVSSFAVLGAAQCYAQDQDVAEAARQERARKQDQTRKNKHVYTNEDVKREHILAPEDRAQLEAKKNQPAPANAQKPQDATDASAVLHDSDASSIPANTPLGDVARHLRKQKDSQKLQRSAEFHLPFSDSPTLASPRPPAQPLRPPITATAPAPHLATPAPFQPPVRRSPFERPRVLPPTLTAPHAVAPAPLTPRVPTAPHAFSPARPVPAPHRVAPALPPALAGPRALIPAPLAPHALPVRPPSSASPPTATSGKLVIVTLRPGDSLWSLAASRLGSGRRWQELLSLNPGLRNPDVICAGTQILVPVSATPERTASKYNVLHGDTLWSIARAHLGHAASWSCIAHANPELRDANLLREGQILLLPYSCPR